MKILLVNESTTVKLGQNANENARLVRNCWGEYTWLHLKHFPSGHVIIEDNAPSDDVIQIAGHLCLSHTKYKNLPNISVSVSTVSNLTPTKKLGEVQFKHNKRVKTVVLRKLLQS